VEQGGFREDLYYRLNVVTVQMPPLRDRPGAIPLLIDHFLRKFGEEYNRVPQALTAKTMDTFLHYHWPGNVRELENMVRRMIVLGSEQAVLQEISLRERPADRNGGGLALGDLDLELEDGAKVDLKSIAKAAARIAEKRVIARILDQTRWNRKEAAERLQISYKALLYKMKEGGLSDQPGGRRGSA
jgi:two-component system response regulator AtoC